MFCDSCGTRLEAAQRFCPSCGKAIGAAATGRPVMTAPPPVASLPHGRVAAHVRLLGILWLASAVIHMVPGFFLVAFFRHGMMLPPDAPPFVNGLMHFVGLAFLGGAVLSLMAGWGLLERQPWARMLAIVLGVLHLINVPFGTALGAYTLWVLLPSDSEAEYAHMAGAA
jgi:hypothetical protein